MLDNVFYGRSLDDGLLFGLILPEQVLGRASRLLTMEWLPPRVFFPVISISGVASASTVVIVDLLLQRRNCWTVDNRMKRNQTVVVA